MSDHTSDYSAEQPDLFETETARSLLDQLIADSRIYTSSQGYKDLLDFVVRLRSFAPFNAMLLQVQKPGLNYAASARDWRELFDRRPKEGARPLLILWPFGPVALVYDEMDTEGKPLPQDVASFFASGTVGEMEIKSFARRTPRKNIDWCWVDAGDGMAGLIRVVKRSTGKKYPTVYRMHVNRNHEPSVQFATIAHELGHLFLGHLGRDKQLNVPGRRVLTHAQQELEAESVAYLVCERNGVHLRSEKYLSDLVDSGTMADGLDVYRVLRAAGRVEELLGLTVNTKFDRPAKRPGNSSEG